MFFNNKKSITKSRKLHNEFLLVGTSLLLLISIAIYFFLTNKNESALTANQENEEKLVIMQISNLVEQDYGKLNDHNFKSVIESVINTSNLRYVRISDNKDTILCEFHLANYTESDSSEKVSKGPSYYPGNTFQIEQTIEKDNSITHHIFYEFSRSDLKLRIQKSQNEVLILSLLIFIVSFLSLLASSYIIMLPLKKIANSVLEISAGNINKRVPVVRKDELNNIANTVNLLTEDLQKANSQVEKLNKELKFQFRDKIGELNYEINKKRQAETLLKESEEQFRLLFELAPIGMVISSIYGKILKANSAYCTTLGYDENELLKRKIKDLTHPDDQALDLKRHEKLVECIKENAYYEKRMMRKDGEIIFVIVEAVAVKNKDGKVNHIIEQVIDITERKRVEKELIFAKEKAEESDRLKSAFLAQMSHEIRTPLNVILTAMQLINDEVDDTDEDNKLLMDSVSSAGKRLQRTIDLILNISAVQSGSYEYEYQEINLDNELGSIIEEFKPLTREKNLKLSYINKAKNTKIVADYYSVGQILQNLIDNAVKYTLEGSVQVILEEWHNDKIRVLVKDTGIGISKEYIADLFSPFSQEDVGQKREFDGNGLGLALVRKYIEINNADILVESEKDKGSTFTVIFNRKQPNASETKTQVPIKSDELKELA